ncbi:MAG: IclR family transcriptional regulator [Dehalococcoidia bacterium]|nr:IclR family transcriptional regulator [Dehalococcoidia bacterium]
MPIQRYFKSLDKAIAVLKCFTTETPELKTSEVASKVGMHRVTAHRLLETLSRENLLHKDNNRHVYTIGIELYALGSIYIENNDIYKSASPVVRKINELTGEVIAVNVSDSRGGIMLLMREERKTGFRWAAHISSVFPAYASAGGKALLSELSEEEIDNFYPEERLKQLTAKTISNKTQLKQELKEIRKTGLAYASEEYIDGIESVASVIRDATGKAAASLVIAEPILGESKITKMHLDKLVKLGASLISYRLGNMRGDMIVKNVNEMIDLWKRHEQ